MSPDQRRADLLALQMRLAETMPDWTDEERQRFVAAVDRVLSGQSQPGEDDWFERVVRPNFSYSYPSLLSSKHLTPREVAEYRKWRDDPVVTFAGNAFSSRSGWGGWILLFAIPGGLYVGILSLAYGSRWVYRGFALPRPVAFERAAMPTADLPALDKAAKPHPAESLTSTQTQGTMSKRVIWFVVVTVLWTLGAALLASRFSWARGPGIGAVWWLWLVLAILWRLVVEFVPIRKKEQPTQKPSNTAGA